MPKIYSKTQLNVIQACSHEWILMEDGDTHLHPLDDPVLHVPPLQHRHCHVYRDIRVAAGAVDLGE
eukprot:13507187-Ditylum_brightwellii.AAC.1